VILNRSRENIEAFLAEHAKKQLVEDEKRRVIKMLEMQRHAMLMYTSCGWFFDEISGIEAVQVMMYAARVMQLATELFNLDFEGQYTRILEQAPSNIAEYQNGAKIYSLFVKPAIVDFARISAQTTMRELFAEDIKSAPITPSMPNCSYTTTLDNVEKRDDGKFRLIVNRCTVSSSTTLDEETFSCAAIWLGDHNVTCGAAPDMQNSTFNLMREKLISSFENGQINEIIVALSKYFGHNYSLKDLFKDDRHYILEFIVADGLRKAQELYEIIYRESSAMLRFMKQNNIPPPKPLQSAAETVLNLQMAELLLAKPADLEKLRKVVDDSKSLSVSLDYKLLPYLASEKITSEFVRFAEEPENLETMNTITALIRLVSELHFELDLWQSQNIAFRIAQNQYQVFKLRQDEFSAAWVSAFWELCNLIGIRLA
jgi:hypothetical protein